jgi:hypothetical protein
MRTKITNIALQITDNGFTVFTTYKSINGYFYDGFTPHKTFESAMNDVNGLMNSDNQNFLSVVDGYEQITFPNNDNNSVRKFISK